MVRENMRSPRAEFILFIMISCNNVCYANSSPHRGWVRKLAAGTRVTHTAGGQCDPAAADTEERGSAVWVSRQGNPRTVHILEPTKEFYRSVACDEPRQGDSARRRRGCVRGTGHLPSVG